MLKSNENPNAINEMALLCTSKLGLDLPGHKYSVCIEYPCMPGLLKLMEIGKPKIDTMIFRFNNNAISYVITGDVKKELLNKSVLQRMTDIMYYGRNIINRFGYDESFATSYTYSELEDMLVKCVYQHNNIHSESE